MSRRRIVPLPLKGLETRESFDADTISFARNIRVQNQSIKHVSNFNTFLFSPSSYTQVARNIVQMFMSPPGGPDRNRLLVFTTSAVYEMQTQVPEVWASLQSGYSINSVTLPSGTSYGRFAIANSAHKLAWTCAKATPPIRVRIYDGTTVGSIAQDYSGEFMIAFNHRILIANTVEGGIRNASRIRWSANRNFLDWSGVTSGFLEVGSNLSSGNIRSMTHFDETAVISLENEIIELSPTGSLFPVFEEGNHFAGVSVYSPESWQVFNHVAFFLGPDTVYAWDRNRFLPIGRPIEKLLLPYLHPSRMRSMQSLILPARGEYHLLLSGGASEGDSESILLIFDINEGRWFHDTMPSCQSIGRVLSVKQENGYFLGSDNFSREFSLRADGVDLIGVEESTSVTPVGRFDTQDFLPLNSKGEPTINGKNTFLALYFHSTPSSTITVGASADKGVTFTTRTVTVDVNGVGAYFETIAFSLIRFTFRGLSARLSVSGPLEFDYELSGEVN